MNASLKKHFETLGFVLAFAILASIAVLSYQTTILVSDTEALVEHTHEVIEHLDGLLAEVTDAETSTRGFVINGDESSLKPFDGAMGRIEGTLSAIARLTHDNADQQRRLEEMRPAIRERTQILSDAIARRRAQGADFKPSNGRGPRARELMEGLRRAIAVMVSAERDLLAERQDLTHRNLRTTRLAQVAGTLVSFSFLLFAFGRMRREIGRRVRSEGALRKSEENLSTTLHSIGDGVISTDLEGRIERFNSVASTLTGWPVEDAKGRAVSEVFTIVNEHTRETVANPIAQVLDKGVSVGLANHTSLIGKDGTETPIADSAAPIRDAAGKLTGAVLVFRGMVAERAAEARIRQANSFLDSIIENIPDMVFVKNAADLRFERINRAGEALLGISREALVGKSDRDFFSKEQADFFIAKDRETLGTKAVLDIDEESIQTPLGTRWLHTKKVPILDESGVPKHLLGISEDITDRKRAGEELRTAIESAQAANRELEAFSYSVAHDLRAPLRAIDGFSQALLEDYSDKLDESGQDFLRRVRLGAQRMAELIDDLLGLSRVTRTAMQSVPIKVTEIARSVVGHLKESQPNVEVVVEDGMTATADPGLVRVVFENLLGNAFKFSARSPHPRVEIGRAPKLGPAVFFVRDNGVGFDKAHASKLFTPFQRLHSSAEYEGSGIGLATVQRIVNRHGGVIWADSVVDGGATFFFTLSNTGRTP